MKGTLTTSQDQEEEGEEKKVVDLRLITGGKEPPDGGSSWLEKLEVGACFLVKEKNNPLDFNLGLFRLAEKTSKAVVLNTPHVPHNLYVDPVAFCNKYRMYEDLGMLTNGGYRIGEEPSGPVETVEGSD
jgi:hypothetical protein